jgi:hypothetical protein
MRRPLWVGLLGALSAGLACNAILGNDSWTPVGGTPIPSFDASESGDAQSPPIDARADRAPSSDATLPPGDAARDHELGADADDSGLSPCLALPAADAAPCPMVGLQGSCAIGECLIVSPGPAGRCQNCQAQGTCSGHADAPCTVPEDCDIGWACYCGACTLMCPLSSDVFCGSSQCINVGNATEGVCYPPN